MPGLVFQNCNIKMSYKTNVFKKFQRVWQSSPLGKLRELNYVI